MRFRGRWVAKGAAFLVVVLALVALLSYVVLRLWNALIPELFHGPVLGFWQAAGLLVLCKILFGGLRGRHGPGRWHGHGGWHRERWREKLQTKWAAMTPEEREQWRGRLRNRWCGWSPDEGLGGSDSSEQPKV